MAEGVFALLGVILGSSLSLFKDWWLARMSSRRKARYLAIRVVCILDDFLNSCEEVVADDGLCMGQRNAEGYLEPQVKMPQPPIFPVDLDWQAIDHSLMYKILSFPTQVEDGRRSAHAWGEIACPPDYEEYFEERQLQFAKLGLIAVQLTVNLRKAYGIPQNNHRNQELINSLKVKKSEIKARRGACEAQVTVC
jgi:hypothetical protein